MAGDPFERFPQVGVEPTGTIRRGTPPSVLAPNTDLPDAFARFPVHGGSSETPDITPGEAVGAVAQRGTGAFLQTAPIIPGMVMGARLGALVPPPFTGPAIAAGITIGGGSALLFGGGVTELAEEAGLPVVSDIRDLPEAARPFGAAGEVLGGSVPFMGAPLMAARLGLRLPSSFAGDYLNTIIDTARRAPMAFTSLEVSGAVPAAAASGVVEAVAPDRPLLRAGAEVAAGLFSPTRLIATISQKVAGPVVNFVRTLTPAGRQTQAAKFLQEAVDAGGEDAASIVSILKQPELAVGGPPLDAAQKSGSRALAEFQADLKTINQQYSADVARQADDALEATSRAIFLLRGTGDPMALREAAQLRSEQFRTMLQMRMDAASRDVAAAAARISTDTPATRAQLSVQAEAILESTLKRARAAERQLWDAVPNQPLDTTGVDHVLARYSKLRGELLEREQFPAILEGTITDLRASRGVLEKAAQGEAVDPAALAVAQERFSTGHLLKLRSRALGLAREADKAGRASDARMYGEVAEAALTDLETAGAQGVGTALDEARRFSRELNDTFTRTFVGKADALGKFGGEVIPPELLLKRALATGEELGALQMRQIEEATRFLADRGRGTTLDDTSIQAMLQAQERVIRLAGAQAVEREAATGRIIGVSPDKLRKFMTQNEEVLQRFPETKRVLQEAVDTEMGKRVLEAQVKRASTYADKKAVVGRLLDVESPADAVRGALRSKNPIGQIGAMARLAKNGGLDAVDGLRAALWEDAFRSATLPGGRTSMPDLLSALDDPIRPGNPSLIRLMRQQGLLTADEAGKVDELVSRIRSIETAQAARPAGTPPVEQTDAIIDTLVRVVGSRAGSTLAGGRTGPQLIAAKRGSEAARSFFEKIPGLKVQNLLIGALRGDPITPGAPRFSLLEHLLERPTSGARAEELLRQVHAYGVQAGVLATGGYQVEGEAP